MDDGLAIVTLPYGAPWRQQPARVPAISARFEDVLDSRQALGDVREHKGVVLEIKRRIAAVDGPMVVRADEHQI